MHSLIQDPLWLFFAILVALFTKHFCADYAFQTTYQLRKSHKRRWGKPLLVHGAAHGLWTAAVLWPLIGWYCLWLALADTIAHTLIDLVKARGFRNHPFEARFWLVHGADQLAHAYTYLLLAVFAIGMTSGH